MRISYWSTDESTSDLGQPGKPATPRPHRGIACAKAKPHPLPMPAEQRGKFRRQVPVVATAQEYGGFPFTAFRSEESYILDQVDPPVGHGCRRADLNERGIAGQQCPARAFLQCEEHKSALKYIILLGYAVLML